MGWDISILEGVAATASEIGSGVYNTLSTIPAEALLVDKTVLEKLSLMAGTEISPIVNNLGETIGYTARAAASSNGATSLSSTFISITKNGVQVTQEMIDAATPLIEGGTTADLAVGDTITQVGLDAAAGVGGAAGTGVGGTAVATVAGPAIAVALGVAAGTALYNIAPEFWTGVEQKLEAAGKMIGDKVISFFKPDGTEYYDEETIAVIKQALIEQGLLSDSSSGTASSDLDVGLQQPLVYCTQWGYKYRNGNWFLHNVKDRVIAFSTAKGIIASSTDPAKDMYSYGRSFEQISDHYVEYPYHNTYTHNGLTVYYGKTDNIPSTATDNHPVIFLPPPAVYDYPGSEYDGPIAWTIVYGDSEAPEAQTLPEEENGDPNKKVSPVPTKITDPLHDPTTDPNHNKKKHYDPTPGKKTDPEDDPEPQVDPNPQPDPEPNPDPNPTPDPDYPEDPKDPNPDTPDNIDEGHDPDPPPVVPIAATALSRVYNPSQSEVDALGNYLWNSVNIQDILGIFNSPIDGIIGFMKLYAKPDIGASREIKLGYLSTGVSAPVVEHQTVTVNCGVVRIPLSKNNATDYPPYTTVQIYLPFIGIEPLNGYDLVGSQLACIYHIDCYTGACVAQLKVTRDNMTAKLYEFSGNCAQQLPLTSGNFHQIAGNLISGVIAGGVTGGAAGAVMGVAQTLAHSNIEVGRSGNLSANAGMLGTRTPYLIITRAVSADAANYSSFYGYPTNKTVYLRNCRGYVRVKDIILHTSATEAEKAEIEELLKKGVYI